METECGKQAVALYVWPSMEVLPVCEEHATKMRAVAAAMGFNLGQLPLVEEKTCTQKVTKREQKE